MLGIDQLGLRWNYAIMASFAFLNFVANNVIKFFELASYGQRPFFMFLLNLYNKCLGSWVGWGQYRFYRDVVPPQ